MSYPSPLSSFASAQITDEGLISSWLITGGFMVVILTLGLFVVSLANVVFSERNVLKVIVPRTLFFRPLLEMVIAAISWVLMGWAMANGGDTDLTIGQQQFATVGNSNYALWFYQLTLLFVSVAIVSGSSLSKRINTPARLGILLFYALAVFPQLFHWVWTTWGWASAYRSTFRDDLMSDCGVIDTAGASVIHMAGGSAGLVILWLLYDREEEHVTQDIRGKRQAYDSRNTLANVCGPLLVWVGSIGLNVATNLPANDVSYVAGRRLVMTIVSGSAAFLIGYLNISFNCHDLEILAKLGDIRARNLQCLKCFISGLVAISAACSTCELEGAATIGIVAAVLCIVTTKLQRYLGVDAAEMAVSVHLVNGAWGLIAAGFFTSQAGYEATYADAYKDGINSDRSVHCLGVFYGGPGQQLGAQFVFALAVLGWTVCVMVPFVLIMQIVFRTAFLDEKLVLDVPEHLSKSDIANYEKMSLQTPSKQDQGNVSKTAIKYVDRMDFKKRNGYSWDYAIVIPHSKDDVAVGYPAASEGGGGRTSDYQIATMKRDPSKLFQPAPDSIFKIIRALHRGRLETKQIVTANKDIIIKIRAPLKVFSAQARECEYQMLLDEEKCKEAAKRDVEVKGDKGEEVGFIKGFEIADGGELGVDLPFRPYESIYAAYCVKLPVRRLPSSAMTVHPPNLFHDTVFPAGVGAADDDDPHPPIAHPFSSVHRLKLLKMILEGTGKDGCGLNLDHLMASKAVVAHFPLHNKELQARLKSDWLSVWVMPWYQSNDVIREYFGEHIALYFKFLAYYSTCMGIAAVVGIGVSIHVIVEAVVFNNLFHALETVYSVPAFCVYISVWSCGLVDHWSQSEAIQSFRWGMDSFKETETERKEYKGTPGPSFIDGKATKYFPVEQRQRRLQVSIMVTVGMMMLAIGCVAAVFKLKDYLVVGIAMNNGEVLANFVNFAQVSILSTTYDSISKMLNEQENCKTETQYENSMIIKLIAFNAVNAYAAVFYIAFIKEAIGDRCVDNSCVGELAQTLLIVFGSHLLQSPITQLTVPWLTRMMGRKQPEDSADADSPQIELELLKETYKPRNSIDDYSSLAIDYGYMTLFVAAVPFAPLLAFIATFLEIRIDGYKLLHEFRRPQPLSLQDIGMWRVVFMTISYAGVFTNAAIVFHTGKYFDWLPREKRLACAAVSCVIVFTLRSLYSHFMGGSIPAGIDIQKERREHIVSKVIEQEPDPKSFQDDLVSPVHQSTAGRALHVPADRDEEEQDNGYEANRRR